MGSREGLQVIGIGLMRTGTSSLHLALEKLLDGKCYRMQTVLENPKHADFWLQACRKMPSDDEWRDFFKGYKAAIGFPTVAFYERLIRVFPDAKVILTERDPIRWSHSVRNTIARFLDLMATFPLDLLLSFTAMRNIAYMTRVVYTKRFKHDISKRFSDQVHMVATFVFYLRAAKRVVPADRLFVFQAFEGWEPLCKFLEKPMIEGPYPHLETTAESVVRIQKIERPLKIVQALLLLLTVVVALLLCYLYLPLAKWIEEWKERDRHAYKYDF